MTNPACYPTGVVMETMREIVAALGHFALTFVVVIAACLMWAGVLGLILLVKYLVT